MVKSACAGFYPGTRGLFRRKQTWEAVKLTQGIALY
jgi:hypothetical protein